MSLISCKTNRLDNARLPVLSVDPVRILRDACKTQS